MTVVPGLLRNHGRPGRKTQIIFFTHHQHLFGVGKKIRARKDSAGSPSLSDAPREMSMESLLAKDYILQNIIRYGIFSKTQSGKGVDWPTRFPPAAQSLSPGKTKCIRFREALKDPILPLVLGVWLCISYRLLSYRLSLKSDKDSFLERTTFS